MPVAKVWTKISRPLIRFRQQHRTRALIVDFLAQFADHLVGFRQVLARRPLSLDQVWDSIQPETIDSEFQPEGHDIPHLFAYRGVGVISLRLITEYARPVVGVVDGTAMPVR